MVVEVASKYFSAQASCHCLHPKSQNTMVMLQKDTSREASSFVSMGSGYKGL